MDVATYLCDPDMLYSYAESKFALELQMQRVRILRQIPIGPYKADFYFEENKLVLEIDGREFHSLPADINRDRQRDRYMNNLGYCVVRVTASMAMDNPGGIIRAVRNLKGNKTYFINSQIDIVDIFTNELETKNE